MLNDSKNWNESESEVEFNEYKEKSKVLPNHAKDSFYQEFCDII